MEMWIKIAPDTEPNNDGKWIVVSVPLEVTMTTSWIRTAELLAPHIPEGWHLVELGGRA